jgi:hypothetical protein
MRLTLVWIVAAVLAAGGCSWFRGDPGPVGDERFGIEIVDHDGVADFHERASAFYDRLAHRRVNTYATFSDRVLREYFPSEQAFADYYADLADDLDVAHFEQNRAVYVQVDEFMFDGPGRARVRVKLVGENGLPLRPGDTEVEREDQWVRRDGRWWIVPGKL